MLELDLATTLGELLGQHFDADPAALADLIEVRVRRDATGSVDGFYLPATKPRERARIVISSRAQPEQARFLVALGLGHHYLRHRTQRVFGYPAGTSSEAFLEARAFAMAFVAAGTRHDLEPPLDLEAWRARSGAAAISVPRPRRASA